MSEDSAVVQENYAPGEALIRERIRRYGIVRCLTAAALPDHCSSPAEAPGEGDGIHDEIAELVTVHHWMQQEELALALGMDLDGAIAANQGDIDPIIADRIVALRALVEGPA